MDDFIAKVARCRGKRLNQRQPLFSWNDLFMKAQGYAITIHPIHFHQSLAKHSTASPDRTIKADLVKVTGFRLVQQRKNLNVRSRLSHD